MTEAEYWLELEFRICREISGVTLKRARAWWCDGLLPDTVDSTGDRIAGQMWMCCGERQEEWRFELVLNHIVASSKEIDWSSHLPREDQTRWLTLDIPRRHLLIEPSKAIPDPS